MVLNIQNLIDDAKCFESVRELRWPGGVTCPDCDRRDVTKQLREGIVAKKPTVTLSGEVECDEVYVIAGHKGHPAAVKKKAGPDVADG